MLTQKAGETAWPLGWIASECEPPATVKLSLPETRAALVSDQPEDPSSKEPPGARP